MRYDDDDYQFLASDELPVMQQPPTNGRHGFVLHDACWSLLQKAFEPGEIPVRRLVEVCRSLPFPLGWKGLSWGHDYGGLLKLDLQTHYPWEERFIEPSDDTAVRLYAAEDPYEVTIIPRMLTKLLGRPPECVTLKQARDCFSRLPWEILEAIAIELPTGTALSLRLVSISFLPLLSSGTFWASRFEARGERGFLFEKWNSRDDTDWLSLYQLTSHAVCPLGLRNRRRIWSLIRPLVYLTKLSLAQHPKVYHSHEKPSLGTWTRVAGNVVSGDFYRTQFDEGCRVMGKHIARMPKHLSKIAFSISGIGNVSHLTGIRLMTKNGPETSIGYTSEGNEVTCEITELRGFRVAMGPRGLRALQVVSKDGTSSKWIGSPEECPVSERVADNTSIGGLAVSFDGYKIVSLDVSEKDSSLIQVTKAPALSLRKNALWYPRVPPPEIYLNETSFTGQSPSCTDYRPLFWIHFGGPGGAYLEHITGVSVQGSKGLRSLEFHYDGIHRPSRMSKLGRCDNTEGPQGSTFLIDGINGERLESIEANIQRYEAPNAYDFLRHGTLKSVKMTTNRKRSFQTGTSLADTETRPVEIAYGTTLTGLYASKACTQFTINPNELG